MKKKVTFFINNIYEMGGMTKVVIALANELSKFCNVEIISLHKDAEQPFYSLNKEIKIINFLGKQKISTKKGYPYYMYVVRKLLKDYKTDIFVCSCMGYVGMTLFMRKRAKYIAWEHSSSQYGKIAGTMWFGRVLAGKYADNIVVLTKQDMEQNIKRFKSEGRITQIYDLIDQKTYSGEYDCESKKIITAGRLEHEKGFDLLIESAEKVFDVHSDWELDIYGDGSQYNNLKKQIIEKGLEKNIILKGRTNEITDLYSKYSFYISSSRVEGFGMSIFEAQNAKLPVISFNCPFGPAELVINEINGFLVKCFDVNEMSDKINTLIEDVELRKRFSANALVGKEEMESNFIIEKWKKLLGLEEL